MPRLLFLASLLAAGVTLASAIQSNPPTTCNGAPNTNPPYRGEPTLLRNVTNGQLYTSGPQGFDTPLLVLHVYGDDYSMGFAYGSLLKEELADLLPKVQVYLYNQMNASMSWIAEPWRDVVMAKGLEAALNLTYLATAPYTPTNSSWERILQGMADGAGLDFWELARFTMIPEFIQAQCSMVGAWGPATASKSFLQLRALDWGTDGPFQQYPLAVTWHPTAPTGGNTFTTLSWPGMLGAITGWAQGGLSISEKVWDAYTGVKKRAGYAFHYLLADILRWDQDIDSALSRVASANRTCAIWMGLGDGAEFKEVAYSNQEVGIINPKNFRPYLNHDRFDSLLFINKHVQPSSEPCMNDLIHWLYGQIDAPALARDVCGREETGNMHIAIYDYLEEEMWVSNASPGDGFGNNVTPAFQRPYIVLNMTSLWGKSVSSV